MKAYLEEQSQKRQRINNQYKKQKYTFNTPLIIRDPFGVAPLTAMVLWEDSYEGTYRIIMGDRLEEIYSKGPSHELHLVGLSAGQTHSVTIQEVKEGQLGNAVHFEVVTEPLPVYYQALQVQRAAARDKSWDHMALNLAATKGRAPRTNLCCILYPQGEVCWYYSQRAWNLFKQLRSGRMLMDAPTALPDKPRYIPTGFVEMNFLGEVIRYYEVPNGLHHDVHEMPNGNFLVLTDGAASVEDHILELDRETGQVVRTYDMRQVLDPGRKTGIDKEVVNSPLDWLHLNSVFYDASDDTLIVSSRNQNCVVKFERTTTQIKWLLGSHDHWGAAFEPYLLEPIGEGFEWSWAQHSAFVDEKGLLWLFDNGNFRSYELADARLAYENYSRGVAYEIDEQQMTVHQVWQYGKERGSKLKCPYLGSVSLQTNGNPFICFGGITKDRFGNPVDDLMTPLLKASAQLMELKKGTDEVVFEMTIRDNDHKTEDGFVCYRAEKIKFRTTRRES